MMILLYMRCCDDDLQGRKLCPRREHRGMKLLGEPLLVQRKKRRGHQVRLIHDGSKMMMMMMMMMVGDV